MSDVIKDVQDQHAHYSKLLVEKRSYATQIKDQIKQLRQEYKTAISQVAELIGAINMGTQVIDKLKASVPPSPAVVEGEVVA